MIHFWTRHATLSAPATPCRIVTNTWSTNPSTACTAGSSAGKSETCPDQRLLTKERNTTTIFTIAEKGAGGSGLIFMGRAVHPVLLRWILAPTVSRRRRIPIPNTSPFAMLKKSLEYDGKNPIPTSCEDTGQNTADAGLYTKTSSRRWAPKPMPAKRAMFRKSRRW